MTNSEAIKMLKSKMDGSVDTSYEWTECVRLAIKALEEQDNPNSIRINFTCKEEEFKRYEKELLEKLKKQPLTVIPKEQPCEDCVSRQTLDEIKELMTDINGDTVYAVRMSDLRQLPSVTPQKVGRWIRVDKDKLKCSECEVIHYIAQYPQSANINYCPNCGAKMVEPQESEG